MGNSASQQTTPTDNINYKNNMELNENNKKLNETHTLNKELLQNSIKINDIFYSDIISKIN